MFEAKGDKKAAAADFRRALSLDPSLVGAKNGLKRLGEPQTVSVESDKLIAQGRALAEKNCAWCHAIGKTGDSPNPRAPPWRDIYKRHPILALRDPLTRGIARPHDEMPKFELTDDEDRYHRRLYQQPRPVNLSRADRAFQARCLPSAAARP